MLGTYADIPQLVKKHGVQELLLTAGTLPGKEVRELLQLASRARVPRESTCPVTSRFWTERMWRSSRVSVAIADLLRDGQPSTSTSAASTNGSTTTPLWSPAALAALARKSADRFSSSRPKKLVLVDRSETGQFFLERELAKALRPNAELAVVLADLTDRDRVDAVLAEHQPQIVFHAAAYKHVPLMEAHVGEAVKNIVLATRNLVDLAEEHRRRRDW